MNNQPFWIEVEVSDWYGDLLYSYVMNHNDPNQRRVLGEQCRNAFEAGQQVWTCPKNHPNNRARS